MAGRWHWRKSDAGPVLLRLGRRHHRRSGDHRHHRQHAWRDPANLQIVADIEGGGQNLFNLSSNSSLEVGALYRVEGPGIPVDTHFIYDTSVLIGEPGSVNLTKVTGSDVLSGTFTLTKSMPVGQWAANVTAGATSIDFGVPLDLEPGLYSIAGDAIGICDVPLTTTTGGGSTTTTGGIAQISVPSAMFGYAGGTSISLFVMAAKKTIVIPFDQTGQPQVYWDVVQQPVRLNATGSFAFQINGMPDQDWYSITKIPGSVLSGLIPGLRYNLSGAGIKVGSTFVAPNGGTSIEIDQAAEASAPNALITISGPRTPDAPFDPAIHDRFDEEVLSIELSQNEGDFATLDVELKTRGSDISRSAATCGAGSATIRTGAAPARRICSRSSMAASSACRSCGKTKS
jgi:hypothetical protein